LLARRAGIEGVSFSGGEPFLQAAALLDLVRRLAGSGLSLLAFSGYTLEEIRTLEQGAEILAHLDVLIAGRYLRARPLGRGLLGSSNQQLHLLSPRHTRADFADIPVSEVILHADGSVTLSGLARPLLGPS
jgi:anaerobic ribonucleoside-triphosphate reductase activating protein